MFKADLAAVLPTELSRLLEVPILGVDAPRMPFPDIIMTEDAGELPGVSAVLPVAGLSTVIMLDTESRNCWLLLILASSSTESITFMLAFRASTFVLMSASKLTISPFTVSLSLIPFCIMDMTLSTAGM
jgi:hypothetical protein